MKTSTATTTTLLAAFALLTACDSYDHDTDLDDEALIGTVTETLELEIPVNELSDEELEQLGLEGAGGAEQTVLNAIYQCDVDVGNGSTNCDPAIVDANEFDPGEWTGAVHMDANGFRRMDIYAEICDPTLYAFSISDSPTTNGWGGDSGTADHDAELHMYNSSMLYFSSVDVLHNVFANTTNVANAHGGGCQIVHTITYHKAGAHLGVIGFDGGNGSPMTISDNHGPKLDYVKCQFGAADPARGISCDYEDAARHDEKNWYFGLNRTVGSGSRDGTGVERACVVVSDDVSHTPANCLTPAPISVPPEGTRKMCMVAGTQAQMQADCENGAQVNLDFYLNGTWSTQDYISHWGDPCPVGTSIVPNSQYYVANSCSPLPHVGAGCGGPGSYNWEFQIGVQCQ
ncbi:hypothetical protein [Enhygromyxa salina]|uniref:Lipoprotein n=1 Tax=Enhygromyxa salina TaxID=215803 RepID=A0A2S9XL57_9BACT|nr:hypothetical protein [Enhygromyxa salina]PRP93572.1 hypothetical protein ENSA7_80000 [Enhygromyxa salina]